MARAAPAAARYAGSSLGVALPLLVAVVCAVLKTVVYDFARVSFLSSAAFTLFALASAAVFALAAHQPWASSHFPRDRELVRIAAAGIALALAVGISTYALTIVGTVRVLVLENLDIIVLGGLSWFVSRHRRSAVIRGVVLALAGAAVCVYYNPSQIVTRTVAVSPVASAVGAPVAVGLQDAYGGRDEPSDVAVVEDEVVEQQAEQEQGGADEEQGEQEQAPSDGNGRRLLVVEDAVLEGGTDADAAPPAVRPLPGSGRAARAARSAVLGATRVLKTLEGHTMSSVVLSGVFLLVGSLLMALSRFLERGVSNSTRMNARRCHSLVLTTAVIAWLPVMCVMWALGLLSTDSSVVSSAPAVGWTAFLFAAAAYGAIALMFAEYSIDIPLQTAILPSSSEGTRATAQSESNVVRLLMIAVAMMCATALACVTAPASVTTAGCLGQALFAVGCLMTLSSSVDQWAIALARGRGGAGPDTPGRAMGAMASALGLALSCCSGDRSGSSTVDAFAVAAGSVMPASAAPITSLRRVLRHVWEDNNSRKILIFLSINFVFMFVEITVGWITNSLGLISDAGHMFFDNASLFIGLYASYMARWKADDVYTYGYARYEVLAGFVNAIFLVFVAVSVVFEALERLWEPPEIHGEHVLPVSVLGFLVNMVGLVFFHDSAHGHGGHGDSHHGHSHGTNENMHGVFLHVLADALGSLGVIVSSLLIQFYGWNLADPVASIFISVLILLSVVPLIQATLGPLVQRMPAHMEGPVQEAIAAMARLPDVEGVEQLHVWKHHADVLVGSVHLRVAHDADEQKAIRQARSILEATGINVVTVQADKDVPPVAATAFTSSTGAAAATSTAASSTSAFTSNGDMGGVAR